MSLIQEINRTETEKNKTKQVAINIDNKLVELGGEQAINLADVPNKINGLLRRYKKTAIFDLNQVCYYESISIPLKKADFEARYIIVKAQLTTDSGNYGRGWKQFSMCIDLDNIRNEWKVAHIDDYYNEITNITFNNKDANNINFNYSTRASTKDYYITLKKLIYVER